MALSRAWGMVPHGSPLRNLMVVLITHFPAPTRGNEGQQGLYGIVGLTGSGFRGQVRVKGL